MPNMTNWVYKDAADKIHGPYSGHKMHDWWMQGHFYPRLLVKRVEDTEFEPLTELARRTGNNRELFLLPRSDVPSGVPQPNRHAETFLAESYSTSLTTKVQKVVEGLERSEQEKRYSKPGHKEHMARERRHLAQRQPSGNALPEGCLEHGSRKAFGSQHKSSETLHAHSFLPTPKMYPCTVFNAESLYARAKRYREILNQPLYILEDIYDLNDQVKRILEDEEVAALLATDPISQKPEMDLDFTLPESQVLTWSTFKGRQQDTQYHFLVQVEDALATLLYWVDNFKRKCQTTTKLRPGEIAGAWERYMMGKLDDEIQSILSSRNLNAGAAFDQRPQGPSSKIPTPSEALDARLDAHTTAPIAGSLVAKDREVHFDLSRVGPLKRCEQTDNQHCHPKVNTPITWPEDHQAPTPNHATNSKPAEIVVEKQPYADNKEKTIRWLQHQGEPRMRRNAFTRRSFSYELPVSNTRFTEQSALAGKPWNAAQAHTRLDGMSGPSTTEEDLIKAYSASMSIEQARVAAVSRLSDEKIDAGTHEGAEELCGHALSQSLTEKHGKEEVDTAGGRSSKANHADDAIVVDGNQECETAKILEQDASLERTASPVPYTITDPEGKEVDYATARLDWKKPASSRHEQETKVRVEKSSHSDAPRSQGKQTLGENLYFKVHAQQPQLAGKITGMLLELDDTEIVRLINDGAYLRSKVAEAYLVYEAYVKSNRSSKENLRQTLQPKVQELLDIKMKFADMVTAVILEMEDAAVFDLMIDEDALCEKIAEVVAVCEEKESTKCGAGAGAGVLADTTSYSDEEEDEDFNGDEDPDRDEDSGEDESSEEGSDDEDRLDMEECSDGRECSEDADCSNEEDCSNDENCSDEKECPVKEAYSDRQEYSDGEDCLDEDDHYEDDKNSAKEEFPKRARNHDTISSTLRHEIPDLTPEVTATMDRRPFPRSILNATCIEAPTWEGDYTWGELKEYVAMEADPVEEKMRQVMRLQAESYAREREEQQQRPSELLEYQDRLLAWDRQSIQRLEEIRERERERDEHQIPGDTPSVHIEDDVENEADQSTEDTSKHAKDVTQARGEIKQRNKRYRYLGESMDSIDEEVDDRGPYEEAALHGNSGNAMVAVQQKGESLESVTTLSTPRRRIDNVYRSLDPPEPLFPKPEWIRIPPPDSCLPGFQPDWYQAPTTYDHDFFTEQTMFEGHTEAVGTQPLLRDFSEDYFPLPIEPGNVLIGDHPGHVDKTFDARDVSFDYCEFGGDQPFYSPIWNEFNEQIQTPIGYTQGAPENQRIRFPETQTLTRTMEVQRVVRPTTNFGIESSRGVLPGLSVYDDKSPVQQIPAKPVCENEPSISQQNHVSSNEMLAMSKRDQVSADSLVRDLDRCTTENSARFPGSDNREGEAETGRLATNRLHPGLPPSPTLSGAFDDRCDLKTKPPHSNSRVTGFENKRTAVGTSDGPPDLEFSWTHNSEELDVVLECARDKVELQGGPAHDRTPSFDIGSKFLGSQVGSAVGIVGSTSSDGGNAPAKSDARDGSLQIVTASDAGKTTVKLLREEDGAALNPAFTDSPSKSDIQDFSTKSHAESTVSEWDAQEMVEINGKQIPIEWNGYEGPRQGWFSWAFDRFSR